MTSILCYSWNSDQIKICPSYQNNRNPGENFTQGGFLSRSSSCYNPLFFDEIAVEIQKFQPKIIVFTTENEPIEGTYFHSDFLPAQLNILGYKLLTRDKYVADNDQTNALRMSIYIQKNDNSIQSVELNKGLIFNDNKYQCDKIYLGVPKALVIYLQSTFGSFAFIGVQTPIKYGDRTICMNGLMQKFINTKNIDHIFLAGDFANQYFLQKNESLNYDYVDQLRQIDIPTGFEEDLPIINSNDSGPPEESFPLKNRQKFVVPTYSPSYTNRYVRAMDAEQTYQELSKTNSLGSALIGYHDRIFHKTLRGYPIRCLEYKAVLGNPMLSNPNPNVARQRNHLGVLGVYSVEFDH